MSYFLPRFSLASLENRLRTAWQGPSFETQQKKVCALFISAKGPKAAAEGTSDAQGVMLEQNKKYVQLQLGL